MARNSNSKPVGFPRQLASLLMATDSQRSVFYGVWGANTRRKCYAPYGFDPIPDIGTPLSSFTGVLRELHTGLYLLGNGTRGYSPALMRFLSADSWSPFGEGGVNAYAYCGGDPVNQVDPTAHAPRQKRSNWQELPSAAERGRPIPGTQMLLTHLETANPTRHALNDTDVAANTRQQAGDTPPPLPPRVRRPIEETRLELGAARLYAQQLNHSRHLVREEGMQNAINTLADTVTDRSRELQLHIWAHEDQARDTRR
ncbi:RHS repeat-associated core domain-containing protein [Pseudomonas soli]|uniref:RHS repeat-associated core domain-containing protein n=1 Tax=Pseudomonas soli TaxID=1306993 RepID=UPI0038288208